MKIGHDITIQTVTNSDEIDLDFEEKDFRLGCSTTPLPSHGSPEIYFRKVRTRNLPPPVLSIETQKLQKTFCLPLFSVRFLAETNNLNKTFSGFHIYLLLLLPQTQIFLFFFLFIEMSAFIYPSFSPLFFPLLFFLSF